MITEAHLWVGIIGMTILFGVAMATFLKGRLSKEHLMELIQKAAQVVDVRTPKEFEQAHAQGSLNIPLDQLEQRISELDRHRSIVVCCASGMRSSMAKRLLEKAGFQEVHNAGPWRNV